MYPDKYRYSKEHEWIHVNEDGTAVIGITHHAQNQLGDIVYVDLPDVGDTFDEGEEFGSLESVKAVAEVFLPLTGEIIEINEMLEEHPEMVNSNPHESGWLIKLKIADKSQLDKHMDAAAYGAFAEQEAE